MRIETAPGSRAAIPLTSLVDVVFILLFFFMLASRLATLQAIDVDLSGGAGAVSPTERTVFVDLAADGTLALDGRVLAPDALLETLSAQSDLRVVVRPGEGVSLQALVDLMDRLRATGARLATAAP